MRNAQAQAASNARLAARGAVAQTDIVEANTQVNVFQDNVFSALQNVQRLQTQIKSLILANPADPVWFANLVPTTAIAQIPQEPAFDALIISAIANRPEIAQLRSQRDNANSNLAFARDQLRPQIDLGLSYTSNGFAGNPVDPATNPIFGLFGAQISRDQRADRALERAEPRLAADPADHRRLRHAPAPTRPAASGSRSRT